MEKALELGREWFHCQFYSLDLYACDCFKCYEWQPPPIDKKNADASGYSEMENVELFIL